MLKEREYRPDGLFLPPEPEQPALILEAQMAANDEFLLRLYAESGRVLQHQQRQGRPIRRWRMVVICPSRELNFGDPLPVEEYLRERVIWVELLPERLPASAAPLQRALSLLLLPEEQVRGSAAAIRREATGSGLEEEIDDVIAAIPVSRFNGRTIQEIGAMGGITVEEFTSSVAYQEIYGLGREEGRRAEAAALTLRLLRRRCGVLASGDEARIQALPQDQLEALADALLDFLGPEDLRTWLAGRAG